MFSQLKIPSCEKNATSIGFICFIYLIYKEDEAVAAVLSQYITIWPRVMDERSA